MADHTTKNWETIRGQMSLNEERVLAYQRLMRADVRLSELRSRRGLGEMSLANTVEAAELEHESDLYLATLGRYVAALGGHLEVRAVFPEAAITVLTVPEQEAGSA